MKRKPIRLTEKQKFDELRHFIALCFLSLEGYDDKEIANFTGKHWHTIYRLRSGRYTLDLRYRTVEAIGAAAGLKLRIGDKGVEVELTPQRRKRVKV